MVSKFSFTASSLVVCLSFPVFAAYVGEDPTAYLSPDLNVAGHQKGDSPETVHQVNKISENPKPGEPINAVNQLLQATAQQTEPKTFNLLQSKWVVYNSRIASVRGGIPDPQEPYRDIIKEGDKVTGYRLKNPTPPPAIAGGGGSGRYMSEPTSEKVVIQINPPVSATALVLKAIGEKGAKELAIGIIMEGDDYETPHYKNPTFKKILPISNQSQTVDLSSLSKRVKAVEVYFTSSAFAGREQMRRLNNLWESEIVVSQFDLVTRAK